MCVCVIFSALPFFYVAVPGGQRYELSRRLNRPPIYYLKKGKKDYV